MSEDIFLQQIREMIEIKLSLLSAQGNSGERWMQKASPELVQSYLFLKMIERLKSIDDTLITMLNPSGKDKP